jgi:hypothetical protein
MPKYHTQRANWGMKPEVRNEGLPERDIQLKVTLNFDDHEDNDAQNFFGRRLHRCDRHPGRNGRGSRPNAYESTSSGHVAVVLDWWLCGSQRRLRMGQLGSPP